MTKVWRKLTFQAHFEVPSQEETRVALEGWLVGRVFCILSAHASTSLSVRYLTTIALRHKLGRLLANFRALGGWR